HAPDGVLVRLARIAISGAEAEDHVTRVVEAVEGVLLDRVLLVPGAFRESVHQSEEPRDVHGTQVPDGFRLRVPGERAGVECGAGHHKAGASERSVCSMGSPPRGWAVWRGAGSLTVGAGGRRRKSAAAPPSGRRVPAVLGGRVGEG